MAFDEAVSEVDQTIFQVESANCDGFGPMKLIESVGKLTSDALNWGRLGQGTPARQEC